MNGKPILTTIEQIITDELTAGYQSNNHLCHLMTISYIAIDKSPQATIVVLRHYTPNTQEIIFYTDLRSPKITALRQQPQLAALFYNSSTKHQFRINGIATCHHQDFLSKQHWQQASKFSKQCYYQNISPSQPIDATNNLNEAIDETLAYKNFVVVSLKIQTIDFLDLSLSGHRRFLLDVQKPIPTIKILAP